eukprot:Skav228974  [mRNA]  locus=scaffold671:203952:216735:+ [translate_table: standard]
MWRAIFSRKVSNFRIVLGLGAACSPCSQTGVLVSSFCRDLTALETSSIKFPASLVLKEAQYGPVLLGSRELEPRAAPLGNVTRPEHFEFACFSSLQPPRKAASIGGCLSLAESGIQYANLLDAVICIISAITLFFLNTNDVNLSVARAMRLLRLTRTLRVVRVLWKRLEGGLLYAACSSDMMSTWE